MTIKFLTLKNTKKNYGYIYTYPNVDDIVEVEFQQVVRKLNSPKNVLRGAFQFNVHVKDL